MDGTGLIAKINKRNVCVCGHLKTFWTCATPATVPFAPLLQSWSNQLLCAVLQLSQQIQHSPLEVLFREDALSIHFNARNFKKLKKHEETDSDSKTLGTKNVSDSAEMFRISRSNLALNISLKFNESGPQPSLRAGPSAPKVTTGVAWWVCLSFLNR